MAFTHRLSAAPKRTSQFGYITAQARYFLDVLQTGIAVSACPFPTFPTRVLNRPHKMVDVTTTSGPAALFKKFAKIANVRRSSWAIGHAIRIAYWTELITKMMLGYGKNAARDRFQLSILKHETVPKIGEKFVEA